MRWREASARYATNLDDHLFGVEPGGVLAVEPYDAELLVRREWERADEA